MKLKYCILSLLFFYLNISSIQAVIPQMEVSPDERGVSSFFKVRAMFGIM
jgi:hypothetical protein